MDSTTPGGAPVAAAGLSLRGPRGWVYRDIGFEAPAGGLVAVEGQAGSGRTCLLLTLAGRMRPTSGTARVAGHPLPKRMAAVRAVTSLGPVTGVNDLDPSLTVAEHIHERILLHRRYRDSIPELLRPGRGRRAADEGTRRRYALDLVGLEPDRLPRGPRTAVRDLSALDTLRLGTALALVGRPLMVCVDNADRGLDTAGRKAAWLVLRSVAEAGVTVVAACAEAPEDVVRVRVDGDAARTGHDAGHREEETANARA